jgi:succinate dehydrogenase / fumarate reductase membrane anchor subunit
MMTKNKDRIQSPLAKARGLGSSHEGAHHWLQERVLAAALLPLVFWLVYSMIELRGKSYFEFTQWLGQPWNAALLLMFIIACFLHAVMGLQVVIEDYVSCHCKKLLMISACKIAFAFMALASFFSILQIAL